MHLKTGDKVVVISGKDKGKEGVVTTVKSSQNKVVVEGVNVVKKHIRPSQMNPDGGIVEFEAPIHASNVMVADPKTGKPTRVGIKFVDGKKVRFAKKSGEVL
ncbi:MAG: 50S ribosomal protein L24 [Turicibacter sp.]|nr:50S ribosomal protein L24 [Turicibacter sp.]